MKNIIDDFNNAVTADNVDIVKNIARYIDDETLNKSLITTCIENSVKVALHLLTCDRIDIHYNDDHALISAVRYNRPSIVNALISAGANVHVQNGTPIGCAIMNNYQSIVKFLLEAGARVDSGGQPVKHALENGYIKVLSLINAHMNKCSDNKIGRGMYSSEGVDKVSSKVSSEGVDKVSSDVSNDTIINSDLYKLLMQDYKDLQMKFLKVVDDRSVAAGKYHQIQTENEFLREQVKNMLSRIYCKI